MAVTRRSEAAEDTGATERPEITTCRRTPGTVVFLESGNTDGWIATDLVVEPTR